MKNSFSRWMVCLIASAMMPYFGSAANTITKSGLYYYTLCPNTTSTSMQYTYGSVKIVVPPGSTVKVLTDKIVTGGSNYAGTSGADIDYDGVGTVFTRDCEIGYNVHLKSRAGWNATYEVEFAIRVTYTSNLSLDFQGGSDGTSSAKVSDGDSMPSIKVPSRSGYRFKGYYTDTNGRGTQYYSETGTSARKWDRTDSITLYAYWESTVTYAVTYKPGPYGTGTEQTAQKQIEAELFLKGALFTRNGYTQTGWSKDAGGSTKDYELNGSYTTDEAIDLYPYWFKNNAYSISYSLGGGSHGASHPISAQYGTAFCVSAPTRSGYVFSGWMVTSGLDASSAKWGTTASAVISIQGSSTLCTAGMQGDVYFLNLTLVEGGNVTLSANWTETPNADWYVDAANGNDNNVGRAWSQSFKTIQKAVDVAVAGDVILVNDGRYGAIWTANKKVRIVSVNGANVTTIDGNSTNRCATLGEHRGENETTLSGFTLANGKMDGADLWGGGVCCGTLENCILRDNEGWCGGGAYWSILRDCTIKANIATVQGGGVCESTLTDCVIEGNQADDEGGGAYDCELYGCTIVDNKVRQLDSLIWESHRASGGGVCKGILYDCVLRGNSAEGTCRGTPSTSTLALGGGACYAELNHCKLLGNEARGDALPMQFLGEKPPDTFSEGGGAYDCELNNCLLNANSAAYGGGASRGTLRNCTLSGNTAMYGGGAYSLSLRNCIIWGNAADKKGADVYVSESNSKCSDNCTGGSVIPGSGNFVANPQFADAANGDFRLLAGSCCIDAGNNEFVSGETDLQGLVRISNGVVDMGAYEFQSSPPPAAETYTITYSAGMYGSGSSSTSEKTKDVALTLPGATFTRTGYMQTGWSTDYDGSTKNYSLSGSYTSNSDATLYPYWTANTYSISYALNGGSHGSTHPASATYDSAFCVSAPSRSGYTFAGWTVTSGLNASTAKWGTSSSPSTSIGSSLTKCANGASSVYFKNLTAASGGSVTLTANWTVDPMSDFEVRGGVLTEYKGAGGAVTIPSGVTSIGAFAFYSCEELTSVAIPSGVTSVGGLAFANCSSLTSVTLPSSLASIGMGAFSFSGLKSVTIPSGVTSIDWGAFEYCSELETITVASGNTAFTSADGILYNKGKSELVCCPGGKTGPLTIPAGVTTVGIFAFCGCDKLTSVTMPSGVATIEYEGFYGCSGLESVTIPSSVTSIGDYAFGYCSGLTSMTIPSGVTSIGDSAFVDCGKLTAVYVEKGDGDRVKGLYDWPSAVEFIERVVLVVKMAFDANGGTGVMEPLMYEPGRVYKLPKCGFAKPEGKTRFVGWAGSNGRRYDDEMLVFNLAQPGGTVRMTAIWE